MPGWLHLRGSRDGREGLFWKVSAQRQLGYLLTVQIPRTSGPGGAHKTCLVFLCWFVNEDVKAQGSKMTGHTQQG